MSRVYRLSLYRLLWLDPRNYEQPNLERASRAESGVTTARQGYALRNLDMRFSRRFRFCLQTGVAVAEAESRQA